MDVSSAMLGHLKRLITQLRRVPMIRLPVSGLLLLALADGAYSQNTSQVFGKATDVSGGGCRA
jgi:hypothetical protein